MPKIKRKLIEVALPLETINRASAYEKMPGIGPHPRGLHLWWARRPLATARAVIFAQMVDDPSGHPELFPTAKAQDKERQRLFGIIEDLVQWGNTTDKKVLQRARDEITRSWRQTCADNADDPRAGQLFVGAQVPGFHDPFSGGGALPVEAQRLGLETFAADLNPVAVLINKAMVEVTPRFAAQRPVNPASRINKELIKKDWSGANGLADDIRFYAHWLCEQAQARVGHLYPKIEITAELAKGRPDLKKLEGKKVNVIAWLWARTVKSPNPAFRGVEVPLASTFLLSSKVGKEAYVEPIIEGGGYRFTIRVGKPKDAEGVKNGTKLSRGANFRCLMSREPIDSKHIYEEARAGRMSARLMAIVAEGERGRIYVSPTREHEAVALKAKPTWKPDVAMPDNPRWFSPPLYGLKTYGDLFTPRQLVGLTTLSDLIAEAREQVRRDAVAAGIADDDTPLSTGGTGATAYADAVSLYLAFALDRCADFSNTCTRWVPGNQKVMNLFGKQAIGMTWDFPEAAILHNTVGGFVPAAEFIADCIGKLPNEGRGHAVQQDAMSSELAALKVVSTDPPYYDNIGYADLSDFFFPWLRHSLRRAFPDLFATRVVPKDEELVATPYRHGGKEKAEHFFLEGMTQAMRRLAANAHPGFPVTIYYAFKQSESTTDAGTASTGWETFLDAVIRAGFALTGTWPMRSEQEFRMVGLGTNALASSIVLVCRPRPQSAATATRRELIAALKSELPDALNHLQRGNIAPVDLAQAAIGPGMAVYTRFSKVLDADGKPLSVREALGLINQTLDEVLAAQEGDFDVETRWALAWFDQFGFAPGDYGVAETLSTAKNTSVDDGLVKAGIVESKRGKVRLLKATELADDWEPTSDRRITAWEVVHHLIRVLGKNGEQEAALLVKKLGASAEPARELAYRLFALCEKRKRAPEALTYNSLVQSWPEIIRLSLDGEAPRAEQAGLFAETEE